MAVSAKVGLVALEAVGRPDLFYYHKVDVFPVNGLLFGFNRGELLMVTGLAEIRLRAIRIVAALAHRRSLRGRDLKMNLTPGRNIGFTGVNSCALRYIVGHSYTFMTGGGAVR